MRNIKKKRMQAKKTRDNNAALPTSNVTAVIETVAEQKLVKAEPQQCSPRGLAAAVVATTPVASVLKEDSELEAVLRADARSAKEKLQALASATRSNDEDEGRMFGSYDSWPALNGGAYDFFTHTVVHFDVADDTPGVNDEDGAADKEKNQRNDWLTSESAVASTVDATQCGLPDRDDLDWEAPPEF